MILAGLIFTLALIETIETKIILGSTEITNWNCHSHDECEFTESCISDTLPFDSGYEFF